jgi:hypothetical protein
VGYQSAEGRVFVLSGTSIIRGLFRLGSPNPPIDLGGRYLLTFTADAVVQVAATTNPRADPRDHPSRR